MASDTCWRRHTCSLCKQPCWCDTIKAACPWRTGIGEDVCQPCFVQYAELFAKLGEVEES